MTEEFDPDELEEHMDMQAKFERILRLREQQRKGDG